MAERPHVGLADLPQFTIGAVELKEAEAVLTGVFDNPAGVRVGRAWLYRPGDLSIEGDLVSLDHDNYRARLEVSRVGLSDDFRPGLSFPYFYGYYEPSVVDMILDEAKEWTRVKFQPTDSLRIELNSQEGRLFGEVEVGAQIPTGFRIVERLRNGWAKEHCTICQAVIGPSGEPFGWRDARDAATALNSCGPWLCDSDYAEFASRHDLGFLVT